MAVIEVDDLTPFAEIDDEKAEAMIADAVAMAELVAPCITDGDFAHTAAAKAVLRGAILRWHDSGNGAVAQQTAGPYQQVLDTRQPRRSLFWPSEIEQLQRLCKTSTVGKAFESDLTPAGAGLTQYPYSWDYPSQWDVPPPDGPGPII